VVARALEAGLLVLTAGDRVIRLLPPLVISAEELAEGLELLHEVIG
jgi:4-aminobutyrate aminotransferase-like enzyme